MDYRAAIRMMKMTLGAHPEWLIIETIGVVLELLRVLVIIEGCPSALIVRSRDVIMRDKSGRVGGMIIGRINGRSISGIHFHITNAQIIVSSRSISWLSVDHISGRGRRDVHDDRHNQFKVAPPSRR